MTHADALSDAFKQTEIGLIPEEWEVKPFSHCLAKVKEPKRKSIQLSEYRTAGKFPIVDQSATLIGGYTDDETSVISEHLPVIIFGDHTRVFKYVDFHFALGADGTKVLRADNDLLDPSYFYFYLKSLQIPSKGYNRHFKYLKEQLIAIPKDRTEQRAIAHILSKIQAAAEAQAAIAKRARELKRALMAKLFTEGLRGEPLKETEIGLMPEGWEVVKLGERVKVQSGGTPSRGNSEYWSGTIPWVKTGEINYRIIVDTEEKITPAGLANSSARLLPAGTLLMAMYGQGVTRGRVAILGIEATTNQACAALFPNETLTTEFLYVYLTFAYERVRNMGHGAQQRNLSGEIIKTIKIPVSSLDEQHEIARILQTVDAKIASAERKRAALEELFRAMLGQLMTGRVRVKGMSS